MSLRVVQPDPNPPTLLIASLQWSFLGFFILFEFGSVLCGAAQSSIMLIVGRAFAGMGSSGLLNGGMTILTSVLVPAQQPGAMGVLISLGQWGIACGPLVGGAFTEYVSWRWCKSSQTSSQANQTREYL
jgi:MFS family permease